MKRGRWFLPDSPDLLGMLRRQVDVTNEGLDAFEAWARGDAEAGRALPEIEHRGDAAKRELLGSLRESFVTPIEPEDLFALSRGVDWILDYTRDLVSEAEAMGRGPDDGLAEMAPLLAESVRKLGEAIDALDSDPEAATAAAQAAITAERRVEHSYYAGMARLLEVPEMRDRVSLRELYRHCTRIGEQVIDVAERVTYAVVKES